MILVNETTADCTLTFHDGQRLVIKPNNWARIPIGFAEPTIRIKDGGRITMSWGTKNVEAP